MLSMSIQIHIVAASINPSVSVFSSQNSAHLKPFRPSSSISLKPRTSLSESRRLTRKLDFSVSVSELAAEALADDSEEEPEDVEVTVAKEDDWDGKQNKGEIVKPRLVLKFIWMEKNIGIGLDHLLPEYGAVPLSPYYFWPRKDAWEELKVLLESKPWITQKQMIILLNQATDIINLWQQSGGDLSSTL